MAKKSLDELLSEMNSDGRTDVTVEITVTNRCNRKCAYCFEKSHDDISSPEEEERQLGILRRYCDGFDRTKHRILHISIWGGEPMMNTGFLFRIFRETCQYDFVRYMMFSNGTLVERFQELLAQDFADSLAGRLEVQLSYDGEPHHTLKRGPGAEDVFKVADMLIERRIEVAFKATLSMDALSLLPQVWDSYRELHDRYDFAWYAPTLDQINAGNLDESFEIWKNVVEEVARKERRFIMENRRPLWTWFTNPGKLACELNDTILLHCDGKAYVCHGCPYMTSSTMERFVICKTDEIDNLEGFLNKGFKPHIRARKCVDCSAVACSVCHVNELGRCPEDWSDYKEMWTKAMVNTPERCRFFEYFGMVYRALRMSMMEEVDG